MKIFFRAAFLVLLFSNGEISGQDFEKALPQLAERWLDPSQIEAVLPEVEEFREPLRRDDDLTNSLREFLKKAERTRTMEPVTIAACYDIIGDFEAAHSRYQRVRSDAVFLHQIRLYQHLNPEWDERPLDDDLSDLYNSRKPAFRIARFEAFIRFLESRSANAEASTIEGAGKLEVALTGRYGPPIWFPEMSPETGGKLTAAERERQVATFEKLCTAVLEFPDHAAWAFSRLAALEDFRGQFSNNPELLALAESALKLASAPTPLGGIDRPSYYFDFPNSSDFSEQLPVRFVSPELYVAFHLRETGEDRKQAEKFGDGVSMRFDLLTCSAEGFTRKAGEALGDGDPSGRLVEVVELWKLRGSDSDVLGWFLDLERRFAKTRDTIDGKLQIAWAELLEETARSRGPDQVRYALEQLALIYLGRPDEREKALATLEDGRGKDGKLPMSVKYFYLLRGMATRDELIFFAATKARELGRFDRFYTGKWLREEDFTDSPEHVIEKLKHSPLFKPIGDFRMVEAGGMQFFHLSYPDFATVFERIASFISRKLTDEQQQPFREFLKRENTFGTNFLLAALEKDDGEEAVAEFLHRHLNEIGSADIELRKELAEYAFLRLQGEGEREQAIRTALADALSEKMRERSAALVRNIATPAITKHDRGGHLSRIVFHSPSLGVATLRRMAAAADVRPDFFTEDRKQLSSRHSWLMGHIREIKFKTVTLRDEQRFSQFYLMALADPELEAHLGIRREWLEPRFSRQDIGHRDHFEKRLEWLENSLPPSARPELLFICVRHFSSYWLPKEIVESGDVDFFSGVESRFTGKKRDLVSSALTLSMLRWRENAEGAAIDWNEAANQAALDPVLESIRSPGLPAGQRMELCYVLLGTGPGVGAWFPETEFADTKTRLAIAEALIRMWENPDPVSASFEVPVLRNFLEGPQNADWQKAAARLVSAWREKAPEPSDSSSTRTVGFILQIAASIDDRGTVDFCLRPEWGNIFENEPVRFLAHFIRGNQFELAHAVIEATKDKILKGFAWGSMIETDGGGHVHLPTESHAFYDRALHENLPEFLETIESPPLRGTVNIYLNAALPGESDSQLPGKVDRLTDAALQLLEVEPLGKDQKMGLAPMLRALATHPEASERIARPLLEKLQIDRFPEILENDEDIILKTYGEAAFGALVSAEEYDRVMDAFQTIAAQEGSAGERYQPIWSMALTGIDRSGGDAEKIVEIYRFIATHSPIASQSYAGNLFWHGLADRMPEWRQWRLSLPAEIRNELDQIWFATGWKSIYWRIVRGIPREDNQTRVRLLKRLLATPALMGDPGAQRKAIVSNWLKSVDLDFLLENHAEFETILPECGEAIAELHEKRRN